MLATTFKPIKIRRARYDRLAKRYQAAIDACSDYSSACLMCDGDWKVRIETYDTADMRQLFEEVWHWDATLADISDSSDRARVRKIMALIPAEGVWPYVSYWAGDMEGLMETTQEDDYLSVPNHGDGWHRVVACIELGLPTVDILFIEADE